MTSIAFVGVERMQCIAAIRAFCCTVVRLSIVVVVAMIMMLKKLCGWMKKDSYDTLMLHISLKTRMMIGRDPIIPLLTLAQLPYRKEEEQSLADYVRRHKERSCNYQKLPREHLTGVIH